jgi:hypothetical protein
MASTWGLSFGTSWGVSWDRVYVPPTDVIEGAGNWNTSRRKFVRKLPKQASKAVEQVAKLALPPQEAEIALRSRLIEAEWDDYYLEVENALQRAIALQLANTIHELRRYNEEMLARAEQAQLEAYMQEMQRLDLARENAKRIDIIMRLI